MRPHLAILGAMGLSALVGWSLASWLVLKRQTVGKPPVAPTLVVNGTMRCWSFGTETIKATGLVTLPADRTLRIDEEQGTTLWVADDCLVEVTKKGKQ